MPISGIVITLASNAPIEATIRALRRERALEPGAREGRKIAAVLTTDSDAHNRRAWNWLNELPGVAHVDVVFVSLDDFASRTAQDGTNT